MISSSENFSPLWSSISPWNQVQIRWFLISWNRFEVLFHNLPSSPISIINSSFDLINFEEYVKKFLIPCGFDPYLPLCHSIQVNFPKLVSSVLFLTRDRVKSMTSRSHLLNRRFGRNRSMKRINGFDETHGCESSPLSHGHWIAIGRSRWSHVVVGYKTHRKSCRWIVIGRIRCIFRDLILTVITLRDRRLRLNAIGCTRFHHVSPSMKWRSTVDISRAIGRSTMRHVASHSWSSIVFRSEALDCATSPAHFK